MLFIESILYSKHFSSTIVVRRKFSLKRYCYHSYFYIWKQKFKEVKHLTQRVYSISKWKLIESSTLNHYTVRLLGRKQMKRKSRQTPCSHNFTSRKGRVI